MDFYLNSILSLSIAIPAATGWIRFKKMDPAFLPFNILLWYGFLNELLAISLNLSHFSNALPHNFFNLAESLLLTWQFKQWKLFHSRTVYRSIQLLFIVSWLIENVHFKSIYHFDTYFHLWEAFIISLMAVHLLTRIAFSHPGNVLKDSRFLICLLLILFFTITLLVQGYMELGIQGTPYFRINIYSIFAYTNSIINILFTLAIIWIPLKRNSISLS